MVAVSRPGSVCLFERPVSMAVLSVGERFLGLKGTAIMAWWRNGIGDRCAMAQHRGIVEAERQPNDGGENLASSNSFVGIDQQQYNYRKRRWRRASGR